MKVYAISGLHLPGKPMNKIYGNVTGNLEELKEKWNETVNEDDIVLINVNICSTKYLKDAKPALDYLGELKGKKIILRSNQDYWWQNSSNINDILTKNIIALQNESIRIDGVVICGSRGLTLPEPSAETTEEIIELYRREIRRLVMSLKSAKEKRKDGDVLIAMTLYAPTETIITDNILKSLFKKYNVTKVVYGKLLGQNIQSPFYLRLNDIEYFYTGCAGDIKTVVRIL